MCSILKEDKSRPLSPMGEPSSSVGNKIIEEAVHVSFEK
jgi:hypothetical protein